MELPEFLNKYLWDVVPESLDLTRDQRFIIERVLEKGDDQAVRWLRTTYHESIIQNVVVESRRLSAKSRNYWELILHTWSTSNQSVAIPGKIWQH